ncbi:MAG: AtpZ/AtpI family protein [Syntrophomonadaceae bacterium]|jgi:F0F1-type ATP synthase assembly protein I|nr:AtpZ/AtpI family protein [Syntrophomonadaceae bacterium]
MSEKKKKNWAKSLSEAINLVTTIAAAVGFCGYGGWWLDQKYGTGPKFTAIGVLLGMATAIKVMWDRMNAEQRKKTDQHKKETK